MVRTLSVLVSTALVIVGMVLSPPAALASHAAPPAAEQVVGLEVVYVPPGVQIPDGDVVGPDNVVYGNCGWASMWVTATTAHRAKFEADAGSSIGPLVRVDWTITWLNNDTGANGSWSDTTIQFSPTWGVKREALTGPGMVYGTLTRLIATAWNGVVCQGLVPWDWEQVP